MPQYLAPGVYVEEVPSAIKPIAGVGTSTAGFIGAVADDVVMPLIPGRTGKKADGSSEPGDFYTLALAGTPQLILSWESTLGGGADTSAPSSCMEILLNSLIRSRLTAYSPRSDLRGELAEQRRKVSEMTGVFRGRGLQRGAPGLFGSPPSPPPSRYD